MAKTLASSNVLSGLPTPLAFKLFAGAPQHTLKDGEVLFRAGDVGDGCYRVEQGLLKIVVASLQGEEHTSELQSRVDISYAVLCLKKKRRPGRDELVADTALRQESCVPDRQ